MWTLNKMNFICSSWILYRTLCSLYYEKFGISVAFGFVPKSILGILHVKVSGVTKFQGLPDLIF